MDQVTQRMERIYAPFSAEQVERLNEFQQSEAGHPFTCARRSEPPHRGECELVATINGWICVYCDYRQDWAHAAMADGTMVTLHEKLMSKLHSIFQGCLFSLRALVSIDADSGVWFARCLETGNVATADDPTAAADILAEVLEGEIAFAWRQENLSNLFSEPAAQADFLSWRELVRAGTLIKPVYLNVQLDDVPGTHVAELKIATAPTGSN